MISTNEPQFVTLSLVVKVKAKRASNRNSLLQHCRGKDYRALLALNRANKDAATVRFL